VNKPFINQQGSSEHRSFLFKNTTIDTLTENKITECSSRPVYVDAFAFQRIFPIELELNQGTFTNSNAYDPILFPPVTVVQQGRQLLVICGCEGEEGKLCEHQAEVLTALLRREDLGIFFDQSLRHERFKKIAISYGLENEPDLDAFFQLKYLNKKLEISPRISNLVQVTKESLSAMSDDLMIQTASVKQTSTINDKAVCVVLRRHKHYRHLMIELYQSETTKEGKVKNPLTLLSPLDFIWKSDDPLHLKFFTGITKFQNVTGDKRSASDIAALKAIIKNPLGYDFYYHKEEISENINASSLVPVKTDIVSNDVCLIVTRKDQFYELAGSVSIHHTVYDLRDLTLVFTYFILAEGTLFLVDKLQVLNIIDLLRKGQGNMMIHASKFGEFRMQLLSKLEDKINVEYTYIEPATRLQLEQSGFDAAPDRIVYLSDFGEHVMIIPVMRYGEVEVSIRTRKPVYAEDEHGNEFMVKRDKEAEIAFTALLIKQHPYFKEQLEENDLYYYYLHKKHFLEEQWFLNTFEELREQGVTIYGFNEIEGNKLNPDKITVHIKVLSGINWFNANLQVRFGRKKATLKQVQKALRNKSKYVTLDDGSQGILPLEWIEKFANYFNSGEIVDDETIHIPKVNFSDVVGFYDDDMLDDGVKTEIKDYREKLSEFNSIREAEVPHELHATLRPYQREGLNWLNFLDDFNFGGCLADDMGLGKSIQIIAFILSQRKKVSHNTNLLVVPTTLIFNWEVEVKKFAPSVKILTIYGSDRIKDSTNFDAYEIILTSYGTLLYDINFLKAYTFNYIFLDESHHIKNPETQRYQTVRLLKSRNKIVITGTPLENNTFDLYGQLSFACPGLLGNKRYFRDIYSIPIDKFKNSKRARELQAKIKPFILRRTKQQVASDLPEKTEMVLYCEMKDDQRRIYDAHEKEFRDYISATTGEELSKNSMNVLRGLTKLRQICDSPALLDVANMPIDASSKIDMLMEQIEGKSDQHKILIFSQFVSMLDLLKIELEKRHILFSYLTGSTRNRSSVVNEFQDNPDVKVFLISLKAGGTGLNLTEADYVYLVDPWWNPAVENQAIDRVHRIGQTKKIVAVRLICPGTVEEKIMKMQESKRELVRDLINTDSSFLTSLSKADLLDLFS
jgi:SNF2 family DNA or RNA helicase